MADTDDIPSENPLDQFDPEKVGAMPLNGGQPQAKTDDPIAQFDPYPGEQVAGPEVSWGGAFRRGAERSIVPAATSLVGAGAGAEAGAAVGAAVGAFFPPAEFLTVPGGALIGGVLGMFGGGYAGQAAQDYSLKAMPDSWREAIGMDDRQQKLDESQHPVASFLGGVAPYAVTMRPSGFKALADLPENATALQRIMAHPVTAKVFGGAAMGGMELGQEAVNGDLDWRKVAISTGFGMVFNKPTRLGETLTEIGGAPIRAPMTVLREGTAEALRGTTISPTDYADLYSRPRGLDNPTIAQVGDAKVLGPGVTEDVFQGTHRQDPEAEQTAQQTERTESDAFGETAAPDLHAIARRIEPEVMEQYDTLSQQRDEFRNWIAEHQNPADETIQTLREQQEGLQDQLDQHINERGGYTGGPEARRLRAQIRDLQNQQQTLLERRQAFLEGRAQDNPDLATARQHLMAVDEQMRDLAPQVSAAYRRAVDAAGRGEVLPREAPGTAPEASSQAPEAVSTPAEAPSKPQVEGPSVDEQKAEIARDVSQQLIDAGRPEEEAQAAGQLIAARYATRAGRFQGALGSPLDLYRREGAEIRGSSATRPAPAEQATAPVAPIAAEPAASALPKGYEDWTPGATVKVGPIAGMTVVEARPDGFTLQRGDRFYEFTPPAKAPKEGKTGLEMLEHLKEVERPTEFAQGAPVASVKGDELAPESADIKTLRTAAREHWNENIKGTSVEHQELGKIEFTSSGRGKFFSASADPDKLRLVPALKDIVANADLVRSEAHIATKPNDNIRRWYWLEANVDLGGQTRRVGVNVFEDHKGNKFYNLNATPEIQEGPQRTRHIKDEGNGPSGTGGPQIGPRNEGGNGPSGSGPEGTTYEQNVGASADGVNLEIRNLDQSAKGKIRLAQGVRPIITLARTADASTFIHETGHDFLEQLMRDAVHEAAPDSVKDDAQTVKDWLGVGDAADIKTRHHEKFARGFEQYMREGRAPSPGLAGVFKKFKDWLTQIYQTLKGLGAPISDDIRGVFDRMLAEEPHGTVIAPERPGTPALHEVHATLAEHSEPQEAEAVMDRVVHETTEAEAVPPPEITHEIQPVVDRVESEPAAESGGEAGQRAEEAGDLGEGGGGPESQSGGSGVGEGNHALVGRGRPAGPESSAAGTGEQRGSGASAEPPLSPRPADLFPRGESPLVDKAGNIRIDNLTNEADLAQAIHDSAERNAEFVNVRGPMTAGMTLDIADTLGLDPRQIDQGKLARLYGGFEQLAPKVLALRKLLTDSARIVVDTAKRATESNSAEDIAAWVEALGRHDMIQSTLSRVTYQMGSGLGLGFRNIEAMKAAKTAQELNELMKANTGRTLYQMQQMAKLATRFDNPTAISKFVRDSTRSNFGRMILEYWINGLISGPTTHATYAVGNTILAVQKMGPETAAAAAIGRLRSMMGREGETVRMGEVGAQFRAAAQGLAPALKASVESMRSGVTVRLPNESSAMRMAFQPGAEQAVAPLLDEAARFSDVVASTFGMVQGLRDGIVASGELLAAGGVQEAPLLGTQYSVLGAIPDVQVKGVTVVPIGTLVRLPGRFIAAIHSFFRAMNYSIEKNALAYRAAANEGLMGTDLDARVADLRQNPTQDMMERARSEATELTLMGQGGKFTQALSRLTNTEIAGFPLLKFIDPFVHISSNIIDQAIVQRTPLGIIKGELRNDLLGRNGTIAQDKAQARMLVGTAFAITVGGLAAEGYITGSEPSDPKEAARWRQVYQPHSVRIGDMWYDLHRLGPMGMLMGIGADLYDVAHAANEGEFTKAAAHFGHAITQNVLDESFMRGPSDLIKAIFQSKIYGEQYIRDRVASFIPFSVGMSQVARMMDPYSREARTVVDAIKQKVPGLSMDLMPRRNMWGEAIPNPSTLGGVTAIYGKPVSHDPVDQEIARLQSAGAPPSRKIGHAKLTDQEYDEYSQLSGRFARQLSTLLIQSPGWRNMPDDRKTEALQRVFRSSHEAAGNLMRARHHDLAIRAARKPAKEESE